MKIFNSLRFKAGLQKAADGPEEIQKLDTLNINIIILRKGSSVHIQIVCVLKRMKRVTV